MDLRTNSVAARLSDGSRRLIAGGLAAMLAVAVLSGWSVGQTGAAPEVEASAIEDAGDSLRRFSEAGFAVEALGRFATSEGDRCLVMRRSASTGREKLEECAMLVHWQRLDLWVLYLPAEPFSVPFEARAAEDPAACARWRSSRRVQAIAVRRGNEAILDTALSTWAKRRGAESATAVIPSRGRTDALPGEKSLSARNPS